MKFDPNKVTLFARTDARGQNVAFGIKAKDRQRHMYVIGKTGMGKSTLLENMAVQDIQNGEGMAFIDPHGSAAETLLNYIPEHRMQDVLYFAPADSANPVSFNIMEDVGPDKRHLVVSGLMSVFKKIWVDAWSARMEYILQNTLMALLEYPGSTLLGVNRMLSDKDYRKVVVDNIKDPGVKSFWVDEFAKYNERYMQEAGDAIKNKIGQFTGNPIIRNIIGQPKSSFDIRQMMDDQKIIIMNLSKGLIGESNANLLGSMLTTRIYLAAMSRADLSPEKMRETPNFYFYVDEFQSFANATFANILSEARKYHLNLTIAHQYIEQMEEEVRNAVFGNVGTVISFRVGPFDAEILETIFTPQFLATDIVNLSFAQIYLTLMIDGIGSQPFSATTLPPIAPPTVSCKDMVIAASRRQFSRSRADVELMIHKFHEPIVIEKPPRAVIPEGGRPRVQNDKEQEARLERRAEVRPSLRDPQRRDRTLDRAPDRGRVESESTYKKPTHTQTRSVSEGVSLPLIPPETRSLHRIEHRESAVSLESVPRVSEVPRSVVGEGVLANTQSDSTRQPQPQPQPQRSPLTVPLTPPIPHTPAMPVPESSAKTVDDLRSILRSLVASGKKPEEQAGTAPHTTPWEHVTPNAQSAPPVLTRTHTTHVQGRPILEGLLKQKHTSHTSSHTPHTQKHTSLKDAVAALQATASPKSSTVSDKGVPPVIEEVKIVEEKSISKTPVSTVSKPSETQVSETKVSQRTLITPPPPLRIPHREKVITPKELERMMRVTQSDTPQF